MGRIIEVKGLEKSYKNEKVVKSINFYVEKGEILGFLGPNGAGKSTTINILSTVLNWDKGDVNIFDNSINKNVNEIKQRMGVVPQELAIFEDITAEQNVKFFASLYKVKGEILKERVKEALQFVGLYDKKDQKPKTFSGGMKRRLNIACAIAHQPELIIMDEPTVGIDPQSRNYILDSIKDLKKKGVTVIYATHYMEEVEEIADRVLIMNEGNIIAKGTIQELNNLISTAVTYEFVIDNINNLDNSDFTELLGVSKVLQEEDKVSITVENGYDHLNELVAVLLNRKCKIKKMTTTEASLETVFLDLTGRMLKD